MKLGKTIYLGTVVALIATLGCKQGSNSQRRPAEIQILEVSSTSPHAGETFVAASTTVEANLNFPADPGTVDESILFLFYGNNQVPGTVTTTDHRIVFRPSTSLLPGVRYDATLDRRLRGQNGETLAQDFRWSFETRDTRPPRLLESSPIRDQALVPLNSQIVLRFDKDLDVQTVNNQNILLNFNVSGTHCPTTGDVPCTISYQNQVVTLTPLAPFQSSQVNGAQNYYTVTVREGVFDLHGNHFAVPSCFRFATADTVSPTVTQTVPALGESNADIDIPIISAIFNEPLQPVSVTQSCMTLTDDLNIQIPSTISYDPINYSVDFASPNTSPFLGLFPNVQYSARVRSPIRDQFENPIAGDYVWTFRTGHNWSHRTLLDSTITATPTNAISNPRAVYSPSDSAYRFVWDKSLSPVQHVENAVLTRYPDPVNTVAITNETFGVSRCNPVSIPDGTIYYLTIQSAGSSGQQNIASMRRLPGGNVEAPVILDYDGVNNTNVTFPQAAVAPDGTVHAVFWQQGFGNPSRYRLVANRKPPSGNWYQAPGNIPPLIDLSTGSFEGIPTEPSIAIAPDGTVYVAFAESLASGAPMKIYVTSLAPGAGSAWSTPVVVSRDIVGDNGVTGSPQIAVGPDGAAYVIFVQNVASFARILVNRRDPASGWLPSTANPAVIPIIDGGPNLHWETPKITVATNNTVHAIFRQTATGNNVQSVMVNQRSAGLNGSWQPTAGLTTLYQLATNQFTLSPSIVALANGDVQAFFVLDTVSPASIYFHLRHIYNARLAWNGNSYGPWSIPSALHSTPTPVSPFPPPPPGGFSPSYSSDIAYHVTKGLGSDLLGLVFWHYSDFSENNGEFRHQFSYTVYQAQYR